MIAMILAAGRGERLRPITESMPKALVEVRGKSLLEHHLLALEAAGVETVVINLGWFGNKIIEKVRSGSEYGLNVIYSPEGTTFSKLAVGFIALCQCSVPIRSWSSTQIFTPTCLCQPKICTRIVRVTSSWCPGPNTDRPVTSICLMGVFATVATPS